MIRLRRKKLGNTAACVALLLAACQMGYGQDRSPKRAILGVWRGVSICTKLPGNEACRDETVIYHIVDSSHGPNMISADADKIVNGEVIPMFGFDLAYDSTADQWAAEFQTGRGRIRWSFRCRSDSMTGTCTDVSSSVVLRNVIVRRDSGSNISPR